MTSGTKKTIVAEERNRLVSPVREVNKGSFAPCLHSLTAGGFFFFFLSFFLFPGSNAAAAAPLLCCCCRSAAADATATDDATRLGDSMTGNDDVWCHTPSIAFRYLPPNSARTGYATEGHTPSHTPSTAFRHRFPNSARFSYATEGIFFISAQLSRFGY